MKIFIIITAVFAVFFGLALWGSASAQSSVEVDFFYSPTCPHCAKEKVFLQDLKLKYPGIDIRQYDVINNSANQNLLEDFYEKYNVSRGERGLVPATFTPAKYFVGFSDKIGDDIRACLSECAGEKIDSSGIINVPFFGVIDLSRISLPALTLVMGVLDGFNPCAMWILVILISFLLPLKSRKKIALVGGTFIFAEGLLYFLFMAAWLNMFLAIKYGFWIRSLIGIFGIVFGIWRLKDFFTWKPGVCKIADHSGSQFKLIGKMKNALNAATFPAMLLGVAALAFAVNTVEFLCSAGFPVIYTKVLALQNITGLEHYLYLFFYNILYMIDDLIVFGFAFFALSRFNFSDKYSRYSTLAAGLLILILGILLILKPQLLMFG